MKYLAILKDSLREAIDSKVLLVLFVLSSLVILFVGSISFKPLSAQATMEQLIPSRRGGVRGMPLALALNVHNPVKGMKMSRWNLHLDKVELVRGDADSPHSDYLLTVSSQMWVDDPRDNADNSKGALEELRGIFQQAVDLGLYRIGDIERVPRVDRKNEEVKGPVEQVFRVPFYSTSRTVRIWASEPSLLFGAIPIESLSAPLGFQLYLLTSTVLSIGAWVAVLLGVIITSFFLPNMLRKGTIDMLLVKPIHRWVLLIYKYIGGLTFIFASTAYAIGGMWLVLGIRTGLWANEALLLIPTITFFFAILYAISTFVGVITRSTVAAIMMTIGAWFCFFAIGAANKVFTDRVAVEEQQHVPAEARWGGNTAGTVIWAIHAVTPRTSDLNILNDMIVYTGFMTGSLADMEQFAAGKIVWWESLLVSGAWIALFLTFSCLWFTYKDY